MSRKNLEVLQKRIKEIQGQLSRLGSMRPGSLSEQYNVCGTPGCRCKDPQNPQRHGPYYHLNYSWQGRSRTEFVRAAEVEVVRRQLETYKLFRSLCSEWVALSLEVAQLERALRGR
jgi:hypothetical protein